MGKNKSHVCGCTRKFKTSAGLSVHKSKADHWVYPKNPMPKSRHVCFLELAGSQNWGMEMTEQEEKHPKDFALHMGFLMRIIVTLEKIEKKLQFIK